MGLINNDIFETGTGVQKAGTYLSFNNETLYLRKSSSPAASYQVNANYRIFWDKAAKDAGKSFIELRSVNAKVSEAQLADSLYAILYAELKKQYPNSVDDLVLPAPSAPSSEPAPSAPAPAPAPAPSSEPAPSVPAPAPSSEPAPAPSSEPAPAPSSEPAPAPSSEPAPAPSSEPAPAPSSEPAPAPSSEPAPAPSSEPAPVPSSEPAPAPAPSSDPAPAPSSEPSA